MTWITDAEVETAEQKADRAQQALQSRLTAAVQRHLDETAQERTYDHMLSLCSYATDPDPVLAAEGQAGVDYRSAVWRHCYGVLNAVTAGERDVPTETELLAELPAFEWPETQS